MAKTLQETGDIEFPISARTLTERAAQAVEGHLSELETQMLDTFLPRSVEVILAHEPKCRAILLKGKPAGYQELPKKIGQIFWSHPGTMGGQKIEMLFLETGFDHDQADELATKVYKYSRYTMSLVNNLRMIRSAIVGINEVIDPAALTERFAGTEVMGFDELIKWQETAKSLGDEKLKNTKDIEKWLLKVENQIAEVTTASTWTRRKNLQLQDPNGWKKPSLMSRSMAKAFSRRFGQFIRQEFELMELSGRYATREDSFKTELQTLKKVFNGSDSDIFEHLQQDYDSRQNRIKAASRPSSRNFAKRSSSTMENYISNVLQLDGREVIVKNSSEKISPLLVGQMAKLFKAQMMFGEKTPRFLGRAEQNEQQLILEVEKPTKSDISKIKKLLEELFD